MCSRLETLFLLYKIDPNSQPSSIQMMIYAFVMNPGNFCRTNRKNFDVIRRRIPHIYQTGTAGLCQHLSGYLTQVVQDSNIVLTTLTTSGYLMIGCGHRFTDCKDIQKSFLYT